MSVTVRPYANGITNLFFKRMDFTDGKLKLALIKDSYSPDQDLHDEWSDIAGIASVNEASGTGYTAKGKALSGVSINDSTYSTPGFLVTIDADNLYFTGLSVTFRYGVLWYDDTGTGGVGYPIGYIDFYGYEVTTTNQTFAVEWDADGIMILISTQ